MKFKKLCKICFYSTVVILSTASLLGADDVATYLIMNDIPPYKRTTQSIDMITERIKTIPGYTIHSGAGILAGADHFYIDHSDMSYRTEYHSKETGLGMVIEVTQHSGSDSDRWLSHEIDSSFRDYYGLPNNAYGPRQINGQTILVIAIGGREYCWLSGNKVITIEYHGSLRTLPEPIEVVRAYLVKHPSTLPSTTIRDLRSGTNKTTWIKDEMERRLWLCEKWDVQFQLGKVQQKEMLQEEVKSMIVFLDYREKYYSISAKDDKNALENYLHQKDAAAIKNKLTEYKTWWSANKGKAINL